MQPFNRFSMNTSLDRSQILNYTTDFHFSPVRSGRFVDMQTFKTSKFREFMSPAKIFFLRNKESSENVKFIRGVTLTRYILCTYVDSNNACKMTKFNLQKK